MGTINSYNQVEFTKALTELELELLHGGYKQNGVKPIRESCGSAGVFVTNDKTKKGWIGDYVLITPHAIAVIWYFYKIRKITYRIGGVDYCGNPRFIRDLAKSVADLDAGADESMVFDVLIAETQELKKTLELMQNKENNLS
jgi:hypothetical protein